MRIYRLLTSLETIGRGWLVVIAVGILSILGIIDYLTGFELSFSFFYLIPVAMTAWALGRNTGLVFSVLSATVWFTSNLLSGQNLPSPFIGVWNTIIRFGFYAVVTTLLAELRHALEEERILASIDPLTGALNRRSFSTIAEKKMILAEVNRRPYTLVYIDLDNFKSINDSLGHAAGDMVLKTVVDAIQAQIRSSDLVTRLGGDEFAILLTDIDREHAEIIVQRLQSTLLEKMAVNKWEITFSIGALTVLSMPESVDKLVSFTDSLMYDVKNSGKNAVKYSVLDG